MHRYFPKALSEDMLRWIDFRLSPSIPLDTANRERRTSRALLRRLFKENVPGVILADEVGMGKTYEAFGVIAGLFVHCPNSRVTVLTHSKRMTEIWTKRWEEFRKNGIRDESKRLLLPLGSMLTRADDFGYRGITFGSYETIKQIPKGELRAALEICFRGRGIHEKTRRILRKELFGYSSRGPAYGIFKKKLTQTALDQFWRHYVPEEHCWDHWWKTEEDLRRLVFEAVRTKRQADLLVVDEAHKLAGYGRHLFFWTVLRNRAKRALYVTATPFALSVDELFERIKDMYDVTGTSTDRLEELKKSLDDFRDKVRTRKPVLSSSKKEVEKTLGSYLVRSLWDNELKPGVPRRVVKKIPVRPLTSQSDRQIFATLALETAFVQLEKKGYKAHRATHRETLCSSYRAIRDAIKRRSEEDLFLPTYLSRLPDLLPKSQESPKFEAVLKFLVYHARKHEKVVVFCKRLSTISELRKRLHSALKQDIKEERERWKRIQKRLKGVAETLDWPRLRLAAYRGTKIEQAKAARVLARIKALLKTSGEPGSEDERDRLWDESWGPGRHIDWVGALSGQTRTYHGKGRSPESVQFAFNLPGPPYILLCTQIAREGIDLHLWCRHVVQYDLEWNPAFMEQQVGRVDRIGSLSRRWKQSLKVWHAWQLGTYEEYMAQVVEERVEMMRVLLGAGEWLSDSPETQEKISELKKYFLDFSP